jgi:hypothetical protein
MAMAAALLGALLNCSLLRWYCSPCTFRRAFEKIAGRALTGLTHHTAIAVVALASVLATLCRRV